MYSIFKVSRVKTRVSGVCRKKNTRRKIGRGKLTRMKFIRTDSFGQAIYTFAFPTYFRCVCVFLLSVSRCTVEISHPLHHCGHFRFLDPLKFFFFSILKKKKNEPLNSEAILPGNLNVTNFHGSFCTFENTQCKHPRGIIWNEPYRVKWKRVE